MRMRKFISRLGVVFLGLVLFIFFFLIGASLTDTTPRLVLNASGLDKWEYQARRQSTFFYADGQPMTAIGYKRVYSSDFPEFLKAAAVAVEDRRFYEHNGLDTKSIGRAIWINLREGTRAQGASTITQQLARTLFLNQDKTYSRKIKEVLIATALEEKFSKQEILSMYLNEVYMGRGCSGLASAAQAYFSRDIGKLSAAELCMLVGLIQAPEFYNPDTNWEGLKTRQEVVINVLAEQGILSVEEADRLKEEPLPVVEHSVQPPPHPYLVSYLIWKMEEMVGKERLYQGGLNIYTTIDRAMQTAAENALAQGIVNLNRRGVTARDGALVSLDSSNGAVRAMVGGVDFARNQLNMAVLPRQPGSAVKPLYYAAAINEGLLKADTKVNNRPRDFNGYRPTNGNSSAPGEATVHDALVQSYNVASVEVLNRLGLDKACQYLRSFGVTTLQEDDRHLALGLGGMSKGISPLELAAAYAAFPAEGTTHGHFTIERVLDQNNAELYRWKSSSRRVIKAGSARTVNSILRDVVRYGTGTRASLPIPSSGKTGTTTDSRDLWFVGYTSDLATAVWVGNSDSQPVTGTGVSGGAAAAPIWRQYMRTLFYQGRLESKPVRVPAVDPAPAPPAEPEPPSPDLPGDLPEEETEENEEESPDQPQDPGEPQTEPQPPESVPEPAETGEEATPPI